jgi:hypothetical protein
MIFRKSITWRSSLAICPLLLQIAVAILLQFDLLELRVAFFLIVFLLSETHFGSTFLFFLSPENRTWFLGAPARRNLLPAVLGTTLIIGIFSVESLLLLASALSSFHVTRQTVGVSKLLGCKQTQGPVFTFIYIFSALCIGIAAIRFIFSPWTMAEPSMSPVSELLGTPQSYWFAAIAIVIGAVTTSRFLRLSLSQRCVVIAGALTYVPYLCFGSQLTGHLVSVTGHWTQYLIIQYVVYRPIQRSSVRLSSEARKRSGYVIAVACCCVLLYSLAMSLAWVSHLTIFGTYETSRLLIVPLLLQISHYVIDGQIWRFRDPHIQKIIGSRLSTAGQAPA